MTPSKTYDYYAFLDISEHKKRPKTNSEHDLASGFVDGCMVWSCKKQEQDEKENPKNTARQCYMKRTIELSKNGLEKLKLPSNLNIKPDFKNFYNPSWMGIEVEFVMETPWYSRDDRPFHVLDNPIRKDRVFGVPFMSAASWKGLLRWACRMQAGLLDHFEKHGNTLDGWQEPDWIKHFFGNEKGEADTDKFQTGSLVFYPTWFDKVGFEVINPHERKTKAGKQPIYYEVVPAGVNGTLHLLYAPLPGEKPQPSDALGQLIDSIEILLTTYGISAKRTVGWGTAKIDKWKGFKDKKEIKSKEELKELIRKGGRP